MLPASARCVVLQGGEDVFNSGATSAGLLDLERPIIDYVAAIPRLLLGIPVPTIAAMSGHAVGGGLLLGLWCDDLVLAEHRLYGANFMALGLTPGMGATVALEEAFGGFLAREMLYTGRLLTGRELRRCGAPLPHVVPGDEVRGFALRLAREFSRIPVSQLRLLRRTLSARRRIRLEVALSDEKQMHDTLFAAPEARALIASLLAEE